MVRAEPGVPSAAHAPPTGGTRWSTRPRLLLLVSTGWGVRNYLRSGFLAEVARTMDVTVLVRADVRALRRELTLDCVAVERLPPVPPARGIGLLSGVLSDATNQRMGFRNRHIERRMDAYLSGPALWWSRLRRRLAAGINGLGAYEPLRRLERRWVRRSAMGRQARELLRRLRPDVVLATDPYSSSEATVSLVAADDGLPTVGALSSWDNLTYKGHMVPRFSHYVVWGGMMRDDLLAHEAVEPERILLAGSPQFDFHLRPDLAWSREKFFRRIGGDPARILLTWSASPDRTFPTEPGAVVELWDAVERGQVPGRPQLLVRLHPNDRRPERFDPLLERCPGLLLSRPWAHDTRAFGWFTPDEEALALLSNTLRHSDVTINLASSMTLDAAVFDKPVVNVSYTPGLDDPLRTYVRHSTDSVHYRRVVELGAVIVARDAEELVDGVRAALSDPAAGAAARRAALDWIAGPVDGRAHVRIADFVVACASADRTGSTVR